MAMDNDVWEQVRLSESRWNCLRTKVVLFWRSWSSLVCEIPVAFLLRPYALEALEFLV